MLDHDNYVMAIRVFLNYIITDHRILFVDFSDFTNNSITVIHSLQIPSFLDFFVNKTAASS